MSKRKRFCPSQSRKTKLLTLAFAASAASAASTFATPLAWDANGTTPGAGTTIAGIWGGATPSNFWNDDPNGGAGTFTTTTTSNDDLTFSAGSDAVSGTITVSGTVASKSLTFNDAATTISGGTAITVSSGITAATTGLTNIGTAVTVTGVQNWTNNGAAGTATRLQIAQGTISNRVTIAGTGTVQIGNDGASTQFTGAGGFQIGTSTTAGTLAWSTSSGGIGANSDVLLVNGSIIGAGSTQSARAKGFSNATFRLQGNFGFNTGSDTNGVGKALVLDENRLLTVNASNGNSDAFPLQMAKVDNGTNGTIFSKAGTGNLWIKTANSTYTGGTFLSGGTLRIAGDGSLGAVPGTAATNITFSASSTLQAGVGSTTAGNLTGGGTVTLAATRNISITTGTATFDTLPNGSQQNMVINGVISGSGNVSSTGSGGTLTLDNLNLYNGATTIGSGNTLIASTLNDGGTVTGSSIGTSSNAASNLLIGNGGRLQYMGGTTSTDRRFTINSSSAGANAILDASGSGPILFTNTTTPAYGTTNQTRTLTLTGSNTAANTLSSNVGNNGSGAVSVTKTGGGQWVLGGVNVYSGATTVSAGTLRISGSTGVNSTVNVGGATATGTPTLGGEGIVNGTLNIAAAGGGATGHLAPGDALADKGIFNAAGNVTLAGEYDWEFDNAGAVGSAGNNFDQLALTGAAFTLAISGTLNVSLTAGDFTSAFWNANRQWKIVDVTNSGGTSGSFASIASSAPAGEGTFSTTTSAGDIFLNWTTAAVSSISLTNLTSGNLADSNNGNGDGETGTDPAHVHITGSSGNYISEVDGLTSDANSGLVVASQTTPSPRLVMLWLNDNLIGNGSTVATLVNALDGMAGYDIALATADNTDPLYADIQALLPYYTAQAGGTAFSALVKFTDVSGGSNFTWDFASHSDIVVDRIAIVPEPAAMGLVSLGALAGLTRRRRRAR